MIFLALCIGWVVGCISVFVVLLLGAEDPNKVDDYHTKSYTCTGCPHPLKK